MADRHFLADRGGHFRIREHRVHRRQNRRRRTEGNVHWNVVPLPTGAADGVGEMAPHGGETGRIGALETENRLFDIADREDRAGAHPCRCVKKPFGQFGDYLPLRRVGVLGLVNQDMIDPAIQFIEHPGWPTRRHQQPSGP